MEQEMLPAERLRVQREQDERLQESLVQARLARQAAREGAELFAGHRFEPGQPFCDDCGCPVDQADARRCGGS